VKLSPPDDPEFAEARDLLRAQYAELAPKRPGWVGRLAQRFHPPQPESDWVANAVPDLDDVTPSQAAPAAVAAEPEPAAPPPEPAAEAPAEPAGELAIERLQCLAQALDELCRTPLAELVDAA
jgi:hypothetical protein